MSLKLRTCLLPFFVMVFSVFATAVQAQTNAYADAGLASPTVTSDKDDYAPGEMAHITGSGWTLDGQVHVEFKETPDYPDYHIYDVDVDEDGNWKIDYQVEERHLGVKFTVTSDGKQSSYKATHVFTDGILQSVSVGSQNGTATQGVSSSVTYSIDLKKISSGGETYGFTITGLPSGVNANFSPSTVSLAGTDPSSGTTTLTLTTSTTNSAASSPYTFTVKATNVKVNSSGDTKSGNGTLIINPPVCTINAGSIAKGEFNPGPGCGTLNPGVTVFVAATGSGTISYTWQQSINGGTTWTTISGATSAQYNLPALTATTYFKRIATSTSNSATCSAESNVLMYVVNPLPGVTAISPSGTTNVCIGSALQLSNATSNGVWSSSDNAWATVSSSGLVTGVAAGSPVISYTVTDGNGCSKTVNKTVNVKTLPTATVSGGGTVCAGSALPNVSIALTGTAPWSVTYSNGTTPTTVNNITSSPYTITGASAGTYQVVSVNDANCSGSATGSAVVTVNPSTTISQEPVGNSVTYGAPASFAVSASGSGGTLTYQWQEYTTSWNPISDGGIYSGATTATLSISKPTVTMSGNKYRVVVSAGCGSATSNGNATLTVAKADQTITVTTNAPASAVYNTSFTVAATASSGLAVSYEHTGPLSNTGAVYTMNSGTGSGTVSYNQAGDNNYNAATTITETVTAQKATATLSLVQADLAQAYNGGGKTVDYTINPSNVTGVTVSYSQSGKAVSSPTAAGSYAVVAALNNDNYAAADGTGTLVVAQKELTVSAKNQTRKYNTANPALDGILSGVIAADGITASYSTEATQTSNVGDYSITASLNDPNGKLVNYVVTNTSGKLTITQAPASIDVTGLSKTYNGNPQGATITTTPLGLAVNVTYEGSAEEPTDAGTYAINALLNNPNYSAANGTGSLVIERADASFELSGYSGTYDGNEHGASGTATGVKGEDLSGLLSFGEGVADVPGGEATWNFAGNKNYNNTSGSKQITLSKATATLTLSDLTHTYDGLKKFATAATKPAGLSGVSISNNGKINADSYPVTASLDNPNYKAADVTENLVIAQRDITVKADAKNKTYGDDDPALTYKITTGSLVAGDAFTGSLTREDGNNVGSYAIQKGMVALSPNYNLSYEEANLTIGKASLTVTANNKNKIYGSADPALDYSVDGLKYSDAAGVVSGVSLSTATGAAATAGTHPITISGATATNYNINEVSGTLTVGKATLTVANTDRSKVYGQTLNNTDFDGSLTGIVYSDAITVIRNSEGAASTKGAGTYPIAGTLSDPDGRLKNYTVSNGNGTLTVTKATLTVTANDKHKTYGDANPPLTVNYNGFVNNESAAVLATAPTASTTATQASDAGTYAITAAGGVASNYSFNYENGTLTIGKRPVTVTADAKTKVYGSTDPALTYQVTGGSLASGDSFTGALSRADGETVGTYGIGRNTLTAGTNYDLTYVSNNLTITKKAASVMPAAITKVYGSADPALSGTLGGFLTADGVTASYNRAAGETVAAYTINATLSPAGVLNNYDITYGTAKFTITKAVITVSAGNAGRQYSDPNPSFTGTLTGVVSGDGITATYSTTATATSGPGAYPITPGLSDPNGKLGNYTVASTNGTMTVTQEDAYVTYSGIPYFATGSATSYDAKVTLSATIKDITAVTGDPKYDANAGNITNAKVTFHRDNPTTGAILGTANIPVVLVGTDSKEGTASTTFTYTLSPSEINSYGTTLTVYAVVGNSNSGYYTGVNALPGAVTVTIPGNQSVNGGGYVKNTNSIGTYAGTAGVNTNFGFTMQFSKSGSSAKGQANIIIRSNNKTYQVKSNAINSLSVGATVATGTPASFATKANLTDVTNPLAPVSLGGTLDLFVNMSDSSNGGKGDQVSILLQNGSAILFSSNWDGSKTVLQKLGGGNVQGKNSGATTPAVTLNQAVEMNRRVPEVTNAKFDLKAFPNPSATQFNLHVESSNTTDKISLRVYDVSGRTVRLIQNVTAGQTVQLGSEYRPGIYFVEMLQGKARKQVKLLKAVY